MLGLFLLALFVGYCWLWWKLGKWSMRFVPSRGGKAAMTVGIIVIAFAILFGDEIAGRYQLSALCKSEGGYRYYKQEHHPLNALMINSAVEPVAKEWLERYGLRYVEAKDGFLLNSPNNRIPKIIRFSFSHEGNLTKTVTRSSQAQYEAIFEQSYVNHSLLKRTYSIHDRESSVVLGKYSHYVYFGGWASRVIPRHISEECPYEPDAMSIYDKLINSIFIK